jgi:hypothetical protein
MFYQLNLISNIFVLNLLSINILPLVLEGQMVPGVLGHLAGPKKREGEWKTKV